MSEVKGLELSDRGKFLLLAPLSLFALSVLLREPYIALAGVSLFSIFLYARYEANTLDLKVEDKIPKGNKTVDEPLKAKHHIMCDKDLPIEVFSRPNKEFEVVEEDCFLEKKKMWTNSHFSYRIVPKSRGYQEIGKIKISLYDSFKLYKKSIEHDVDEEIMVNSSKEAIKKAKKYAKRTHTEEFVKSSIEFTSTSNEFEGIREYQPGDPLRNIHWKSLSKFQTLMTKVYEKLSPVGTHIMLDCSPSMRRRLPDGTTKLEQAIYVSLEILKNFEILGHDIGMTAYGHKNVYFHQNLSGDRVAFRRLYEKVNSLPGMIDQNEMTLDRYQDELDFSSLDDRERHFSEKLSEVVTGVRQDQIAGVLSALKQLSSASEKKKLVIIISDLEMNPQATIKSIEHLKEIQNLVWLVVPFSPWYEVEDVDEEVLEKAYMEYEKLENILQKIKKLETSIFELHPGKEGFMILEERREKRT